MLIFLCCDTTVMSWLTLLPLLYDHADVTDPDALTKVGDFASELRPPSHR